MANPDRANGFTPVGTLSGASWQGLVRRAVMADTSADSTANHGDIYIGTPIKLDGSGNALPYEQADNNCAGVCVGIGVVRSNPQGERGPFDPDNLVARFGNLTDSATLTIVVYYAPAEDTIFEAQTDSDIADADNNPTDTLDISEVAATATGSRTTSKSTLELSANTTADVTIVAQPEYPDNDVTLANARLHVVFTDTAFKATL